MVLRKDRYEFATSYAQQFATGSDSVVNLLADTWGKALDAAGFKMDMFASVLKAGEQSLPPVTDHQATAAFLTQIENDQDLGNAIYSMWQQVAHWDFDRPMAAPDNRFWFETALKRLADLTQPLGAIQQVVIKSAAGGFLPVDAARLSGQTLTINADGHLALTSRFASDFTKHQEAILPTAELSDMLLQLATFADATGDAGWACDAGRWQLTVIGEGGKQTAFGPLIPGHDQFSEPLRDLLPFPHLLLFDGAPDRMQRLVVTYNQGDRDEKLVIDRRSNTLSLTTKQTGATTRLAVATPEVSDLLDDLGVDTAQLSLVGNPKANLVVTARFRYAAPLKMGGTLSLDDPIEGWAQLAAILSAWLQQFAPQMLDSRLITRHTPKPGDLLYAQVVFHHGDTQYSYLADPKMAVGDRVVVPVHRGTGYGTIVAMNWYAPAQAPYPPAQTKRILGWADPVEEATGEPAE